MTGKQGDSLGRPPRKGEKEGVARAARADSRAARRALVVLGAHRSGTSAMTRVLSLLGAALPEHIMPANSGNLAGYWEPIQLVQINDDLLADLGSSWDDWRAFPHDIVSSPAVPGYLDRIEQLLLEEYGDEPLFVVKDPRLCRLVPLYETVFERLAVEPLYVLINRDPLDVAASLMRRETFTAGFSCLLWLRNQLEAEAATRGRRRAVVSFEALRNDWTSVVDAVSVQLGTSWPFDPSVVAERLDATLSHVPQGNRQEIASLETHGVIADWVENANRALRSLEHPAAAAGSDELADVVATLDRLRTELDAMAESIGPLVYEELGLRRSPQLPENGQLRNGTESLEPVIAELERSLADRDDQIRALETDIGGLQAELGLAERRIDRLSEDLRSLLGSNSWRLTAPLRALKKLVRPDTRRSPDPGLGTRAEQPDDASNPPGREPRPDDESA